MLLALVAFASGFGSQRSSQNPEQPFPLAHSAKQLEYASEESMCSAQKDALALSREAEIAGVRAAITDPHLINGVRLPGIAAASKPDLYGSWAVFLQQRWWSNFRKEQTSSAQPTTGAGASCADARSFGGSGARDFRGRKTN